MTPFVVNQLNLSSDPCRWSLQRCRAHLGGESVVIDVRATGKLALHPLCHDKENSVAMPQWAHEAIITSLWRRNDVVTSFGVIMALLLRRVPVALDIKTILYFHKTNVLTGVQYVIIYYIYWLIVHLQRGKCFHLMTLSCGGLCGAVSCPLHT